MATFRSSIADASKYTYLAIIHVLSFPITVRTRLVGASHTQRAEYFIEESLTKKPADHVVSK